MYFINPHSSSCFSKTVGSIKNIQSFRFPHVILVIQLRGMETSRNPICAAELELGEIGSGLVICRVHGEREGGGGRGRGSIC